MNTLVNRHVDLGRSGPQHHDAGAVVLLLELSDVLAQLFNHLPPRLAVFHVVAVETLGIVLVESRLHGFDGLQLIAHGQDVFLLEHFGIHGSLEGILRINIPTAKDDIVELGQRHDVGIVQIAFLFAAPYPYFVILCHAADRLGQALSRHEHARHERGGYGSTAHDHDSQFALCGQYVAFCHVLLFVLKLIFNDYVQGVCFRYVV